MSEGRDAGRNKRDADHLWHVWMNRRNFDRKDGAPHEHSLYEFKSMLEFLEYGHRVIKDAFEGTLSKIHRQCSRSQPVQLEENVLKCACEGVDVTKCPILLDVKQTFDDNKARYDVPVEMLYRTMAKTCAWHTYKVSCGIEEKGFQIDTSEGYLLDTSDRMFWDNVYQSMSTNPDELDEDEE